MTYNELYKAKPEDAVDLSPYFRSQVATGDPRSYLSAAIPAPGGDRYFSSHDIASSMHEASFQPMRAYDAETATRLFSMGGATVHIANGEY